ncbi:MAG: SDR family NAD(P)-dependent oxidoreductase [Betaproteobacteria bacterium]|nr:MAG: SDR family NAD(P)-dependent oxidoreductase [Betaproteobacteria bacterium]
MPTTKRAALVTGAASGIGRAAVLALARAGYDVAINYSRSEKEAKAVAEDAGRSGVRTLLCRCDVADEAGVRAMLKTVGDQFSRLDVLINNAGTTGMGAGLPGGMGARIRHAHPSAIDDLAADFPNLRIVMAHPGWPWVDETTAVALHKGNVYWEMSGWAPKYFPASLKVDMRARLQDKIIFGSDYPSLPYARILTEWRELGYPDAVMEKIFHANAERILGL